MKKTRVDRFLQVGIVLLLVAFVYSIYAGIHERVVAQGDQAPAFRITADNGRTVTLPDFGGKLLVLNFWASWCPPCVEETPSLSRFASEYANRGVVVLAVSVDHDANTYRAFLDKYKPAFFTARDLSLHEQYGTFMYPETYVIDAKGKVVLKIPEGADWTDAKVTQAIDSLLL
ncbi:MAG: TlpA disulfide reductase family protein [Bryobacteraceae bacterium]|jgi:peroxiredoxin